MRDGQGVDQAQVGGLGLELEGVLAQYLSLKECGMSAEVVLTPL